MKFRYQLVLVFSLSSFCLNVSAQVEPADDCVSQAANAFNFLHSALDQNTVEVTCLTGKGATEMYVTWDCPPEIDEDADYLLQVAVTKNVQGNAKACYVAYNPGTGANCNFGNAFIVFPLSGKESSATRRDLADYCHSLPPLP